MVLLAVSRTRAVNVRSWSARTTTDGAEVLAWDIILYNTSSDAGGDRSCPARGRAWSVAADAGAFLPLPRRPGHHPLLRQPRHDRSAARRRRQRPSDDPLRPGAARGHRRG